MPESRHPESSEILFKIQKHKTVERSHGSDWTMQILSVHNAATWAGPGCCAQREGSRRQGVREVGEQGNVFL